MATVAEPEAPPPASEPEAPPPASEPEPAPIPRWRAALTEVRAFLVRHLLPVSLVVGVLLGVAWPRPGVALSVERSGVKPVSFTAVCIIFFLSGLQLGTDAVKRALTE